MSVDPDGGFDSKFGAWLYKVINGTGGDIYGNREDGFHVGTTDNEGDVMIIIGYDFERNGGMNLILKSLESGDGFTFRGFENRLDLRTINKNFVGSYHCPYNPRT